MGMSDRHEPVRVGLNGIHPDRVDHSGGNRWLTVYLNVKVRRFDQAALVTFALKTPK